ncbi:unnamed protein product [Larinioides sclopetarius]|uniref:Uncharacterized protein n=1 Tax=Larinioides sclopetarius TaxID=280406 RepID=A0AAV2A190_9ARAC
MPNGIIQARFLSRGATLQRQPSCSTRIGAATFTGDSKWTSNRCCAEDKADRTGTNWTRQWSPRIPPSVRLHPQPRSGHRLCPASMPTGMTAKPLHGILAWNTLREGMVTSKTSCRTFEITFRLLPEIVIKGTVIDLKTLLLQPSLCLAQKRNFLLVIFRQ